MGHATHCDSCIHVITAQKTGYIGKRGRKETKREMSTEALCWMFHVFLSISHDDQILHRSLCVYVLMFQFRYFYLLFNTNYICLFSIHLKQKNRDRLWLMVCSLYLAIRKVSVSVSILWNNREIVKVLKCIPQGILINWIIRHRQVIYLFNYS